MVTSRWRRAAAVAASALGVLGFAAPARAGTAAVSCSAMQGQSVHNPPVQLAGGSGTYNFGFATGAVPCTVTWDTGAADTFDLSVTSTGTYSNVLCGTATWDGSFVTVNAVSRSGNAHTEALIEGAAYPYHLTFSHTLGSLTFSSVSGGGTVQITPNPPSPPPQCASQFQMTGSLDYVLSDPNPPPPGGLVTTEISPPAGYPSSTCSAQGGSGTSLVDASELGGGVHLWVNQWNVSATKTDLCFRAHGGVASAGGLLEVDTTGTPGAPPNVEVADSDTAPTSCPTNLHHTNTPVVSDVSIGTNPASVCVTVGTTVKRVTLKSAGSPTAPQVCWTPDPAGPRTCNR